MKHIPIKSANQARAEARALKSVWHHDTHLTLRVLIYVAELLERQEARAKRKPRRVS